MRGKHNPQEALFASVSPESRVPETHPLRLIKRVTDEELAKLSPIFEKMYSRTGRPSVPPETLLKSTLLMALYSVNSERLFCEQLDYNLLFRYFLGMGLQEESFDHSSFSTNRQRLISHEVAERFFEAVVNRIKGSGFLSDEHFTVDGTLIEAWASMKSFKSRDGDSKESPSGKNPGVDFHDEKRSNATHQSVTDPQSRLLRKGKGKEAKLCHALQALMENRHGFVVANDYSLSVGDTETDQALWIIQKLRSLGFDPKTVGADKGYFNKKFVKGLRRLRIKPHVAPKEYAGAWRRRANIPARGLPNQPAETQTRGADFRLAEDARPIPKNDAKRNRQERLSRLAQTDRLQPTAIRQITDCTTAKGGRLAG